MTRTLHKFSARLGALAWNFQQRYRSTMASFCSTVHSGGGSLEDRLTQSTCCTTSGQWVDWTPIRRKHAAGRAKNGSSSRMTHGHQLCTDSSGHDEKGEMTNKYLSLENLRKDCLDILHYGLMLPAPDNHIKKRTAAAVKKVNKFCIGIGAQFDSKQALISIQSLGMLAARREFSSSIVRWCREIIPNLLKSYTAHTAEYGTMELVDTLYWYGYLGVESRRIDPNMDDMVNGVLHYMGSVAEDMTPLDVGKVVHAMASLKIRNKQVLLQMDKRAVEDFKSYEIRDVSRVLWGFGKLNWLGSLAFPEMLKCFEDSTFVASRRREFRPQYVAHLSWAAGRLRGKENVIKMLGELVEVATEDINDYKPEELGQLLKGFHESNFHPGETFLTTFCRVFARNMLRYEYRSISICLVILAHFGYRDMRVLQGVQRQIKDRPVGSRQRLVFDVCWSLSILNGLNEEVVRWILKNTGKFAADASAKEKRQFYQFLLSVHLLYPRLAQYLVFPESFENICYEAWKKIIDKHAYCYPVVIEAFTAIRELGFILTRSELVAGRRFRVNSIRHKSLSQIFAIEADRGFHNAQTLVPGPKIWRRRVLQALGLTVLSLNNMQWDVLETKEERCEYLKSRIKSLVETAKATSPGQ